MENKTFGYIRVSSKEQNIERQLEAFKPLNISERDIYIDKQSGKDFEREQYMVLKNTLRKGDTLVVKSLDRFGRNYNLIIEEWRDITKNIGAKIKVLDMPILDNGNNELLSNVINNIVIELLSYVAEQERTFIKQRQSEGIAIAKANNVVFGRPRIEKPENFNEVVVQWKNKEMTARKAMQILNLKPYTFYKMVKNINIELEVNS